MKHVKVLALAAVAVSIFNAACDGDPTTTVQAAGTKALSSRTDADEATCPNGGSIVKFGIDRNLDNVLQESEVDVTVPVCTGADGTVGAIGPIGPIGPTGEVGATGATGIGGATGATGDIGATGATGDVGATGATGGALAEGEEECSRGSRGNRGEPLYESLAVEGALGASAVLGASASASALRCAKMRASVGDPVPRG